MMELHHSPRPRHGLFSPPRAHRDAVRSREEVDFEPPVERLQPWSMVALAQGVYYSLMGAWPLVHPRSFEKLTGPKPAGWLTRGVGACWLNVGIHLIRAGLRGGRPRRDERGLALRMAATFAAFDFHCAGLRRRVSPAWMINGLIQLGFIALWGATGIAEQKALRRPPIAAHA
jgi:hypothetical protein